jgi:hypothetical protein
MSLCDDNPLQGPCVFTLNQNDPTNDRSKDQTRTNNMSPWTGRERNHIATAKEEAKKRSE